MAKKKIAEPEIDLSASYEDLLGVFAEARTPEDVKAILAAGHDLGNHSENHKNMSQLSNDEKRQEIVSVHQKVKELTGYDMFGAMTNAIAETTIRTLFHIRVEQKVEREEVAKVTGTNKDESAVRAPKKREEKKIYPNDPCPCGSGKKYKQCCGRKQRA